MLLPGFVDFCLGKRINCATDRPPDRPAIWVQTAAPCQCSMGPFQSAVLIYGPAIYFVVRHFTHFRAFKWHKFLLDLRARAGPDISALICCFAFRGPPFPIWMRVPNCGEQKSWDYFGPNVFVNILVNILRTGAELAAMRKLLPSNPLPCCWLAGSVLSQLSNLACPPPSSVAWPQPARLSSWFQVKRITQTQTPAVAADVAVPLPGTLLLSMILTVTLGSVRVSGSGCSQEQLSRLPRRGRIYGRQIRSWTKAQCKMQGKENKF